MAILEVNGARLEVPDGLSKGQMDEVVEHFASTQAPQKPSYLSRVAESYSGAVKPAAAMIMSPFIGEENRQALRDSGTLPGKPQNFAQSINQGPVGAGAGALGSMFAPIAPLFQDAFGYAIDKSGATPSQVENVQAGLNILGPAGMRGLGKGLGGATVSDVANVAKAGINKLPTIGEASGGIPTALPQRVKLPAYNPEAGMRAMASRYGQVTAQASKLYDDVSNVARGVQVNSPALANSIGGVIEDIKATPLHEGSSSVPKLAALQKKLNSGQFDLADAVELRKTLNESFNPSRWTQNAKGTVYGSVSDEIGSILQDASNKIPQFAQAYDAANRYWLNNVQLPFRNKVVSKYFKPEDYYNLRNMENGGYAEMLSPETQQRMLNTTSNVKDAAQLQSLQSLLPEDMAQSLAMDVRKTLPQNTSRVKAAVNTVTSAPNLTLSGIQNTLSNLGDVIGGAKLTPKQAALMEATKSAVQYQKNIARALRRSGKTLEEFQALPPDKQAFYLGVKK